MFIVLLERLELSISFVIKTSNSFSDDLVEMQQRGRTNIYMEDEDHNPTVVKISKRYSMQVSKQVIKHLNYLCCLVGYNKITKYH